MQYPDGLPAGMVPTLLAGRFFRRDRVTRFAKSFLEDGTVAGSTHERQRDLVDRIFGVHSDLLIEPGQERRRRSVLDSVLDQYKYYTGAASPLGTASKSRVAEHLDRVRELEQRALEMEKRMADAPARPGESPLLHGGAADPGGEGIDITLEELTSEWRLMAELDALAI